eukprot:COSAG01_NODE_50854_length_359_cov_8.192308_1_plen_84_part_10
MCGVRPYDRRTTIRLCVAAVRLNAPVTMSQTADPQVFERLQCELASRGEQVRALQASLELARHVHKELQGELESQRRAAVLAAQ